MDAGRSPGDPVHLIFSIWALTQHYADFDAQVRLVLGPGHDPFAEAGGFLDTLFRRLLTPRPRPADLQQNPVRLSQAKPAADSAIIQSVGAL